MSYQLDFSGRKRVTLIAGDGIGPEVVAATRKITDAAGVQIAKKAREAGAEVFSSRPPWVPAETIALDPR
jgi:isocitrate dehydrogenase (NAD+)